MFTRFIAILLTVFSFSGVAAAQVHGGTNGFAAYDLRFGGMTIGHVVVVDADSTGHPTGYEAGNEYWTWTEGVVWPGAFALAEAESTPAHADHDWQIVDHEVFDHSSSEPMPELSLMPGDRLYAVQTRRETASGFTFGDASFLWLMDGAEQGSELAWSWYGIADELDGAETLDPGDHVIRFQAMFQAPEAGSVDVVGLH